MVLIFPNGQYIDVSGSGKSMLVMAKVLEAWRDGAVTAVPYLEVIPEGGYKEPMLTEAQVATAERLFGGRPYFLGGKPRVQEPEAVVPPTAG